MFGVFDVVEGQSREARVAVHHRLFGTDDFLKSEDETLAGIWHKYCTYIEDSGSANVDESDASDGRSPRRV